MGAKMGGGGGGKYDLGQNNEINVTPFVDVMLVLLIIFMVAAPMATVSIALDAPPPLPSTTSTPPKPPTLISVQESGAIFIEQKQTSLENLALDVADDMRRRGVTGPTTEERVFVRADADVMYEQFMAVLNVLQANGYFKIGLISEDIE